MFHTKRFGSVPWVPIQTWDLRSQVRSFGSWILFYQIGRAVAQIRNHVTKGILICTNGTSNLNEHEEINDTSLSFELFCRIDCSRPLNDSDLVHGLLEVEGALVGSSRTEKDCSQFDNDRVTLLLRPEPRSPLDMMQNGSCSILDQGFLYEKYESEFEEGK
uniref:Uncharacterized protein n=1 Tax=Salix viminalis TaxID=40686 RepID=A0A6N2L730_SALVM